MNCDFTPYCISVIPGRWKGYNGKMSAFSGSRTRDCKISGSALNLLSYHDSRLSRKGILLKKKRIVSKRYDRAYTNDNNDVFSHVSVSRAILIGEK